MCRNLFLSLIVGLAAAAASLGNTINPPDTEHTETTQLYRGEKLVLNTTRSYECGLIGFSTDDTYAVQGKVVRVEVIASKSGLLSADAQEVLPRVPGQISVHRYCDAGTRLSYTLKVYVEE